VLKSGTGVDIPWWVFALAGLVSPAHSYNWTAPFGMSYSLQGIHGIWYGIVFSILALSGFESVAPLARETHSPPGAAPAVRY
jgi:amino acid transporter